MLAQINGVGRSVNGVIRRQIVRLVCRTNVVCLVLIEQPDGPSESIVNRRLNAQFLALLGIFIVVVDELGRVGQGERTASTRRRVPGAPRRTIDIPNDVVTGSGQLRRSIVCNRIFRIVDDIVDVAFEPSAGIEDIEIRYFSLDRERRLIPLNSAPKSPTFRSPLAGLSQFVVRSRAFRL